LADGLAATASATSFDSADVGNPDGVRAEALLGQALAVDRADDRADRVGMGVVDVRRGREGVQQGLDRGARHRRGQLAAREVGDHLLVAHRVALAQWHDLVLAQAGEAARLDRRQVASGPLDPQHGRLAAGVVGLAHRD
jgi:hypothetical protein